MSDIENRLADGLTGVAGRSPHPGDLGAGARERLRRRRRTTATVVAAALAVVAIPVGLAVVGPQDGPPDRRETTVTEPVPDDWRVETWRDLTLRVPPGWTWGSGTDWCTTDESAATATPVVSRPGRVARAIFCAPSYGYGVHFFEPSGGELPPGTEGAVQQYRGRRYPYGAWIGYASTGQSAVWVVTDSRTLTRQVLDSTDVVGEVDPNGCATRLEMASPSTSDRLAVCRYASDGWLEQSELLSPAHTREAMRAVVATPRARPGTRRCLEERLLEMPAITLGSAAFSATVSFGCAAVDATGVGLGGRELTSDVMYWALSPGWSGSVAPGVPMPDQLRTE